jgi:hypothetical protein
MLVYMIRIYLILIANEKMTIHQFKNSHFLMGNENDYFKIISFHILMFFIKTIHFSNINTKPLKKRTSFFSPKQPKVIFL